MPRFLNFLCLCALVTLLPAQSAPPPQAAQSITFRDAAGHALPAALLGGAARTRGLSGSAVILDAGRQGQVQMSRAAVSTLASFSVSAWVCFRSLAGAQTLASQSGQQGVGFALQKRADDGKLTFSMSRSDEASAGMSVAVSDFAPTPGLWYHLAGTCDRATHTLRLYANGVRLASVPAPAPWRAGGPTALGCLRAGGTPTDFLDGTLDAVRFFPRALSDAQVGALFQAGQAAFHLGGFAWANPVYFQGNGRTGELRDPDILRDGGVYYLVCTLWPFANYTDADPNKPNDNSSPGIALYTSRDLKVWKFQTWLVKSSALPDTVPYKHQFWAPELHKIHNRYCLIFGGSNWLSARNNIGGRKGYYQFVAVADHINGPYSHFTALKGPGVDTSLFEDTDGKTYVVWPRNEIHLVDLSQIDHDQITVGPKMSQAAVPADFTAIGKPVPETIEGPYLIKRRGTYYCFFAETYRGPGGFYDTGVATASSLAGPWRLDPRWRIFPGGHQALFTGPDGGWWTSYRHEGSDIAPWLSIDPVGFDAQGNVVVTPTQGPQRLASRTH